MASTTEKQPADSPAALRFERKFLILRIDPRLVEHAVRLHPAQFREIHAQRFVNNCYFDSPGLRLYWDAVQGHGRRFKVRMRWYGDLFGPVAKPTLEVKRRQGGIGSKLGVPAPPFTLDRTSALPPLAGWFAGSEFPAEIAQLAGSFRPVLINRYSRRYFSSADRRYRLTIDTACEFYLATPPRDRMGRHEMDDVTTILELKYAAEDDDGARGITSAFGFRVTKHSKYVAGMDRLHNCA
jgi:hypothetical protein